jgi:hypothetical protein
MINLRDILINARLHAMIRMCAMRMIRPTAGVSPG